ncbi:hypothetical protein NPIL_314081 [Nephila pilipes]|uniref:Protein kinase domain-containing protein n=1 Tax=Nephila pilipes TaxID=299642 RepID=A0A8X6TW50_NEPPI|nr:hypothetical protein NPIL_314081 [Nephila pilipes]
MSDNVNEIPFYVGKYYEVCDNVLGRGSFSTVYYARHKVFGIKVALKVIDRNDIKEEYVLKNLHREAKILRKLNHPNIINFYEEFLHNDLYCIAMEYVFGKDLSNYLKAQAFHRISEEDAKLLFHQMISGVQHMHESNILHRDLKQENILVEHGKVIKIVDFGLSNTYQPKIHLRTHCGSLVYAAPELFHHHSVYGAGVDLWSLGVILYSMVVGIMPFEISKDHRSSISESNKDRFLRRISKGLTEQNWEKMGHLSYGNTVDIFL